MLAERLDRIASDGAAPQVTRELADSMLDIIEHQVDRKLASRELLGVPA